MKLIKPFRGVPNGEIYPVDYKPGDECPVELLDAAIHFGAVETAKEEGTKTPNKAKAK